MADKDAPKKRRLFVGTFLASGEQEKLGRLKEFDARVSKLWDRKVRIVSGKKLHLTWMFLGDVAEPDVDEVKRRLQVIGVAHDGFRLTFDRAEFWPSPKKARLLVLVPSMVPPAVQEIANNVDEELGKFQQKREHRQYKPHLTLARIDFGKRGQIALPDWFPIGELLPIEHKIDRIDLIESDTARGDDAYVSLVSHFLTRV